MLGEKMGSMTCTAANKVLPTQSALGGRLGQGLYNGARGIKWISGTE